MGCLLGARVTNPLDHMSAACQAQSQCSKRTQRCRTGKHRDTVHPHVSRHQAFDFLDVGQQWWVTAFVYGFLKTIV